MSKPEEFKNLTTAELLQKRDKTKTIVSVLAGFMGVALIVLIYTVIKTKNYAFLGVAVGSSLTMLPLVMRLKAINDELKQRNQGQS